MTEPTTPSEHLERQTPLSQEAQKSLHSPPLSKSLKTPSPGFVSKIPIPARLIKERSPSTSPTAVIGTKAAFTEQSEHWRQYRPLSNPTTPTSPNEDSLLLKNNSPSSNSAFETNSSDVTTPKPKEENLPTDGNEQVQAHVEERGEDKSHVPVNESSQSNSASTQSDETNLDSKGNLKVRFDDNSPEKIASYWDSLQSNVPNKALNTTPFYKSPLANTVNFDESTTENDDSAFMGEISYVSDSDDIRTYRPSFLDETSFMSEMDATNASNTTLDKEAAVQRFFAGVSESEFTTYEDSRFADFPESFTKMNVQNSPLRNAISSEEPQDCTTQSAEKSHEDVDTTVEKHDRNNITDSLYTEASNASTTTEDQQQTFENNDRSDVRLFSEVVNDRSQSTAFTDEHAVILDAEQTVPVGADSPKDAEQTVPEQENDADSFRLPNISYADIVSHSPHPTSEQNEQQNTSAIVSESSNMEESSDNSWPPKFPLPSTPFGQEASTQIENHSHGDLDYHSEITWNYNEELTVDNNDSKRSRDIDFEQESKISDDDMSKSDTARKEIIENSVQEEAESPSECHSRSIEEESQDVSSSTPYHMDTVEEKSQEAVTNSCEDKQLDDDKENEIETNSFATSNADRNSFSNVETPHRILKQLSSRQISSAPPPTKLDKFKSSESELPKSAKTVRELTPMRLLQSLSRMTTPSDTIKNLNERFKESDISATELDDSFTQPESETKLALESSHEYGSTDDKEKDEDLQQSQSYSDQGENSLLDQYDSHAEGSEVEEYNPDETFEGSQLEPSLDTEAYLYEDMVHAINNLKEIMGELRDGQDVHRNLGEALEANLNELNDKTQKRDDLLLEMKAMKDIVDQTNNEMSELKSQLEKRVRSEEEVDAKLADMTEVIDTLRKRIKNKAEQATLQTDNKLLGSFPSLMLNGFVLMGIFLAFELLFIRVLLRSDDQYDDVFGTMSHGTYYSRDQADQDQSWSVQLGRSIWEIIVNVFHGRTSGMSVPS